MNKTKLSLAIVAYDNYDDIENALNSIEIYTTKEINKKIYIIDNGTQFVANDRIEKFKNNLMNYNDVCYLDAKENFGFRKRT